MFRFKTLAASLACALALPAGASAATLTIRDNPDNGASVFHEGLAQSVKIEYLGGRQSVTAGVFGLQHETDDGWQDFVTLCLQIGERLSLPKGYERVAGDDYAGENAAALGTVFTTFFSDPAQISDAKTAAAVQLIVWEIMEDGADNFSLRQGNFKVWSRSVRLHANDIWVNMIANGPAGDFDVFAANGTQDLLVAETPLPGAALILLSGVAGLRLASRRKTAPAV